MSIRAKRYIKFAVRTFWGAVLIAVISLAVVIQVGRILFPALNDYRDEVEASLSKQLGVDIAIGSIIGEWQGLRPKMSLQDLVVRNRQSETIIFTIDSVVAEASLLSSLKEWRPAIRKLRFLGLDAALVQNSGGRWSVKGMPESTTVAVKDDQVTPIIDDPLDLFLFGRRISLVDTRLQFEFRNDLAADITIPTIALENDVDFHRLVADFKFNRGDQALRLVVEGQGDPRDEDNFNSLGYLQLQRFPSEQVLAALGIASDILVRSPNRKEVDWRPDGLVNLNLWFSGTVHKGLTWSGDAEIEGVPLLPLEGAQWPERIVGQFSGGWAPEMGWSLDVSQLAVDWPDYPGPRMNLELNGPVGQPAQVLIDYIDLEQWHAAAQHSGWLQGELGAVFSDLSPYGELTRVKIAQRSAERGYFQLAASIDQAGVHNWSGVPAVEGVSGYIEASAYGGHVQLQSFEGFTLNFPQIYNAPLDFQTAVGDVRWDLDLENKRVGVSSGLLEVAKKDVAAQGYFHLLLPFESSPGDEPQMTLSIGIEKGFANLHTSLVPYTVPEDLYDWLGRSIKSGELNDGAFIYHGTLLNDSQLHRVLQLSVQTQDAELKFDPAWPLLTDAQAHLLLDDSQFYVRDLSGDMDGVLIEDGAVTLDYIGSDQSPAIALSGDISCASPDCLRFLKNSPIRELLGEEIMSWDLQGRMHGPVDLLVPLEAKAQHLAEQSIDLTLDDNQLFIPNLDLNFEALQGRLHYDHHDGLTVEKIQARLWQRPVLAQVRTEQDSAAPNITVDFQGHLDMADLQRWSQRPELTFFEGTTEVTGSIQIALDDSNTLTFKANSELNGVAVNLPSPLSKTAAESASFDMTLSLDQRGSQTVQDILFRYFHQHEAKALIRHVNGSLTGVSVHSGGKDPVIQPGAIVLEGQLLEGDGVKWYDSISAYVELLEEDVVRAVDDELGLGSGDPFATETLPVRGHFTWQSLTLDSLTFADVSVHFSERDGVWQFQLQSPDVEGEIQYHGDDVPIQVDLTRLLLNEQADAADLPTESDSEVPEAIVSGLGSLDVLTIPAASVSIDQWLIGDRDMGSIRFELLPVKGGVAAYNLVANLPNSLISGRDGGAELYWLRNERGDTTYFDGVLTADDIGPVFTFWNYEKALTSKSAAFNLQIQWPGAPDALEFNQLSGEVDVNLQRGRFIRGADVGENPLVKLVGLLNFDSLVRRLRLDFSDLHPEGLGYELVEGSLIFRSGLVHINQPLKVDMPASQLQLVGVIDLQHELMDAQLVATLPIAGNLTFAAALTGGVPMAVGIFVFGKLFKNQMDKVSSLRYRLYGGWDDPEVELEKIFDNTADPSAVNVSQN